MIDFACKTIRLEELIRCSFNLNKTEYKIFSFLIRSKTKDHSISEIAKNLNLDRTSVQKGIQKLFEKKLIFRRQINLKKGGFFYRYAMKDKETIKKEIISLLDSWTNNAKKVIDSL